jgi:methylthioribose-1-phosphate isomerase
MNTLEWKDGALWLLDQTRLPMDTVLIECRDFQEVAEAIKALRVRGAPAIGLAAAYGAVLAARALANDGRAGEGFHGDLFSAMDVLRSTRPTAVNLFWALDRVRRVVDNTSG